MVMLLLYISYDFDNIKDQKKHVKRQTQWDNNVKSKVRKTGLQMANSTKNSKQSWKKTSTSVVE